MATTPLSATGIAQPVTSAAHQPLEPSSKAPLARRLPLVTSGLAAATGVAVLLAWLVPAEAQAMLLGLGTGSLVAAIGLSVVLTYRGSGTVNLSAGAVATYSAYVFSALRRDGSVFAPPLPASVGFGAPLGLIPALAVAIIIAAVLGALLHLLVFRWLRHAPPLTKLVASVGVLLSVQALVVLRYQNSTLAVRPILPSNAVRLPGGVNVGSDELILTAVVIAAAAALSALFRFTRFGLATRAAAENDRAATLLGFSPDVLAGLNWVLSTVLAAGLGILVASVNGSLDPATITLLIVPAVAAAMLGGFSSFWGTILAAFAIAMVQNVLQLLSTQSWFPQTSQGALPGVREAVPLLAILAALLLRARPLPTRGDADSGRLPACPASRHVLLRVTVGFGACGAGLLVLGPTWRLALTNSLIGFLVCLSLVVLTGFVGQISLAQLAFAGISGFTLSKLATDHGIGFPLAPLAGAVVAAGLGLLVAVPALRVRGVSLAVVTLAASISVQSMVFNNPAVSGGFSGAPVGPPQVFDLSFGPNGPTAWLSVGYSGDGKLPNPWFGMFCLFVAVAASLGVIALRTSAAGKRMLAVRGNERAAAAIGISVAGTKLIAFGTSAFIAGLAGSLLGYRSGAVTATDFGGLASLTFLAYAYLGGITSVTGAVIGGSLVAGGVQFTALKQWFGLEDQYTMLIAGLGLVIAAVLNPEGIAGAARRSVDRLGALRRRSSRHSATPDVVSSQPASL